MPPVILAQARIQANAAERSPVQRLIQIHPFGIEAFDQFQFPPALPFLDAFLARDSLVDVRVEFIPDQPSHAVFASELAASSGPMLMSADRKIVRHADIQSAVAT